MTKSNLHSPPTFLTIDQCTSIGREKETVVADMDGTLIRGRSSFPYFALIAFEVGGIFRLLLLLLCSPLAGVLYYFISEPAGIRVLIFATFVGMKVSDIESVARAVLPKFYASDLHPEAWRVFSSCGKRCVLTANPRIMVEAFLKDFLGADMVLGTEVDTYKGRATGLVRGGGVLVGKSKAEALRKTFSETSLPEIGLGDRETDYPFMSLCKHRTWHWRLTMCDELVVDRIYSYKAIMPCSFPFMVTNWKGFARVTVRLSSDSRSKPNQSSFHKAKQTAFREYLLRKIESISILRVIIYEILVEYADFMQESYIVPAKPEVEAVSHDKLPKPIVFHDGRLVQKPTPFMALLTILWIPLLEAGDLAICPEGTTCREPFLLRFSALFSELTDELVPVAMANRMSMFHGTTARGWKGMDPFYFFMNPSPAYEVNFLNKVPHELTCGAGKSSHDVANYIQRMIAASLSYECTNFTRKDKYRALAGNDGTVVEKPKVDANKVMGC
ncbi:hypothetical protein PVL29_019204 [Vitis rotundifolia]|uniref:Glycerol-3-phosphate acyltransferase RAM2/GPAT1-8 HAD-like domain-containing protein n=1 Tax=Vitis rotundifolia TaxID=103349 RepID=A0AA38Z6V3_VITRO|nr:hypothetical protein PVL29_019204 [Vitis rotundifolia]